MPCAALRAAARAQALALLDAPPRRPIAAPSRAD